MANNGPLPNYQTRTSQYHCKECGVYFDSAQSLDVHLQYHKENLLTKWANQAQNQQLNGNSGGMLNNGPEEANNNTTKIKRELNSTLPIVAAPADSSDNKSNNKSPDSNNSATPDIITSGGVNHPATPQSYHSASSPYQNTEPTNFSPSFHNFHNIKTEGSPPVIGNQSGYPNFNSNMQYSDAPYFNIDPQQQSQHLYSQEFKMSPHIGQNYRYHPYHQNPSPFERSNAQVSSSSNLSPSYVGQNSQPTPSPSPKQCDKCGFVCETAGQLIEHLQIAHPSTPFNQQQSFQFPGGNPEGKIKQEDEPQAEILDLDSQKVHVYQTPEEQEADALKRQQELAAMNNGHNPHSVSAMLSWPNAQVQQKVFNNQEHPHPPGSMFHNGPDQKMYPTDQKLFQPHQMHNSDFHPSNVTTTTHENQTMAGGVPNIQQQSPQVPHPYRPYEHIPVQPNPPVISSTQVQNPLPPANLPAPVAKGGNWKSNEARRPKTYNCSACNKWFTSSGHLKRHYNTTLHKNAVKSSGQPDPATLPISAHHHPTRDPNHHTNRQRQNQQQQQQQNQDMNSQSPASMHMPTSGDDTNSDGNELGPAPYDSRGQHSELLQQPPSGPYDRHPPNIGGPPNMHSNLSPNLPNSLTNLSSGSPPNGEAGPSANNIELSRGLQSTSTTNIPHQLTHHLSHLSNIQHQQTSNHHHQLPPFNLINQQHQHMMGITSSIPPTTNQIFHPMAPPPITTNYPNELSPHVTQTMLVTNSQPPVSISLTSTGEYIQDQQQHHQQPYMIYTNGSVSPNNEQPLPSFAQFAFLAGIQPVQIGNVGGPGSVTSSFQQHQLNEEQLYSDNSDSQQDKSSGEFILPDMIEESNEKSDLQRFSPDAHIIYRSMPLENYQNEQVTVLQPVDQNIQPDKLLVYSPTNNNDMESTNEILELSQDPINNNEVVLSPKTNHNENDMETSSPLITSTGSPLNIKKQTQNGGVHKCIDCDKIFNKACYLTQHNKTFHSGDKPFKCNRCGKRFSDDIAYQSHLKKHAGEKPHKCEQCPKQFNHKTDLRRHMCLHSGYKPYACDTCGKGFIRKDHMIKHCDTHVRKSKLKDSAMQLVANDNNSNNHINIVAFP